MTGVAKLYAVLQIVVGSFMLLACLPSLDHGPEGWTGVGCSLFLVSVSVAYLCGVNAARLFLAGEFVIASLLMIVAAIYVLVTRGAGPAIVVAACFFFSCIGAFAFVSQGSRDSCRR